ncbi:hypothetical protein [Mycolicibacterium austroafricanum]|uniref:hypothetical protein n=1 Tax=Mycolicibacterium austroafricanum TaxID=39687 RepID=UPI001CA3755F|nr:hypothetical protein [Mycolicibacterium austroafricanum]QZT58596.1 hypothetical protein JN084_08445 [Mycolicibacterium austroafricanum]
MSYVIDAAKMINEVQVQFVAESQNVLVDLAKSGAEHIAASRRPLSRSGSWSSPSPLSSAARSS